MLGVDCGIGLDCLISFGLFVINGCGDYLRSVGAFAGEQEGIIARLLLAIAVTIESRAANTADEAVCAVAAGEFTAANVGVEDIVACARDIVGE